MPYVRKFSGDRDRPMVAVYTCPEHGEFECEVRRGEDGEAPDLIMCGCNVPAALGSTDVCELPAVWTPSPVACRVRRVEVTRGKWEKPERPTYLDTRKLGEGQDPDDFWAERKKIWNEKRHQKVKEMLR